MIIIDFIVIFLVGRYISMGMRHLWPNGMEKIEAKEHAFFARIIKSIERL